MTNQLAQQIFGETMELASPSVRSFFAAYGEEMAEAMRQWAARQMGLQVTAKDCEPSNAIDLYRNRAELVEAADAFVRSLPVGKTS